MTVYPLDHRDDSAKADNSNPAFSIIMPLKDKGDFVQATIESVLEQSNFSWELIVVENGSTDEGPHLVKQFEDQRIRYFDETKSISGVSAARNFGIQKSRGEWVLFLDADDLLHPDCLENFLEASDRYESDGKMAVVIAGDWDEHPYGCPERKIVKQPIGKNSNIKNLADCCFAFAPWALHAAIIRRDHLTAQRMWPEKNESLPGEDTVFWFRVLCPQFTKSNDGIHFCDHSGAIYRRSTPGSRDDELLDLKKRFYSACRNFDENFLAARQNGKMPTSEQSAMAVRVLRSIHRETTRQNRLSPEFTRTIETAIRKWLKGTTYLDPKSVFWRARFGEFGVLKTEKKLVSA